MNYFPSPMKPNVNLVLIGFGIAWCLPCRAPATCQPDVDGDGEIGASDIGAFTACLAGPVAGITVPECYAADVDHDGDVDLADWGELQRGFGRFQTSIFRTLEFEPEDDAIFTFADFSDVDGDGDQDMVTLGSNPTVTVFRNSGHGDFPVRDSYTSPHGVFAGGAIVDLDGDGDPDLVGYSSCNLGGAAGIQFFINDGGGSFSFNGTLYLSEELSTYVILLADLNGDHAPDLCVGVCEPDSLRVALNDGAGGYLTPVDYPLDHRFSALHAGDLDEDGDLDLIGSQWVVDGDGANVLINRGDGSFDPVFELPIGESTVDSALDDFNGDGHLDLAIVEYFNGGVVVFFGNGKGQFPISREFAHGASSGSYEFVPRVVASDIDGNGAKDLVISNSGGETNILFNDGLGNFSLSNIFAHGGLRIWAGDLDGDQSQDIGLLHGEGFGQFRGGISILFGKGNGDFIMEERSGFSRSSLIIKVGDLDNDGDLDLINFPGNNLMHVMRNPGDGSFSSQAPPHGDPDRYSSMYSRDIALADLDGDGDLDVADPTNCRRGVRVMRNDGTGIFPTPHLSFCEKGNNLSLVEPSVGTGDWNGDGNLDLFVVAGNPGHRQAFLMFNVGVETGLFGPHVDLEFAELNQLVGRFHPGDIDGDGDTDLVFVTNLPDGEIQALINDGQGQFSVRPVANTSGAPIQFGMVDMDGDGDLDLVAYGPGLRILFNNGIGEFTAGPSVTPNSLGYGANYEVSLADLDQDGDLDVVVGDHVGRRPELFLNDGKGGLQLGEYLRLGLTGTNRQDEEVYGIRFGDLDGDGDLDLIAAVRNLISDELTRGIRILWNQCNP